MKILAVLSLLVIATFVSAQPGVPSDQGTNRPATEIVVTATRGPAPLEQLPSDTTVLPVTSITELEARNVDDLLRSVEGVTVARSYGMGSGIPSQVNVRGVPGQHRALLLVDGFPLNESSSGFMSINEVPIGAIRKIEVVRGPFSALYGSDALSGVVNLLTVDPSGEPTAEAGVAAGNGGYSAGNVSAAGSEPGCAYWMYLDRRTIDNYLGRSYVLESQFDPLTGQFSDLRKAAENYDYEDTRLLGKVRLDLGDSSVLTINARYFDSRLGYGQTDLGGPMSIDSDAANETLFGGVTLQSDLTEGLRSELSSFVRGQEREIWGLGFQAAGGSVMPARSYSSTESIDWQISERLIWDITDDNTLSGGVEYHRIDCDFSPQLDAFTGAVLEPSAGRDTSMDNAAFYLQDEAAITRKLHVIGALRVDSNSEFGEAFSPRAGVTYAVSPDTTLRASAGQAFRAPSLLELDQPAIYFGNLQFQGNPDLDAEYLFSTDAGIEHRFGDALKLHVDGFYNDMDDLIADRMNGSAITYMNVDEAWSAGVESGAEWKFSENLSAFANYTYQQSEDKATGLDLPYMPDHTANGGIRSSCRFGQYLAEFSIIENYVGERGFFDFNVGSWRTLDAYTRTDVSGRLSMRDRYWLGFGIQNVFDETYQETSVLNPAPARLWVAEAGARF